MGRKEIILYVLESLGNMLNKTHPGRATLEMLKGWSTLPQSHASAHSQEAASMEEGAGGARQQLQLLCLTQPRFTLPGLTTPCLTPLCHAWPCHAIPQPAIPHLTQLHLAQLRPALPCPAPPCPACATSPPFELIF